MTHDAERFAVTRPDGVRAIVCDRCYSEGTIENYDPRGVPCQTEAYERAWEGFPHGDG